VLRDLSPNIPKKMKRRYGYHKEKERHAKKHDPKKEKRIKGVAMSKKKIKERGVTQKRSHHIIIHPHTCTS
jgi:hypothetical protein